LREMLLQFPNNLILRNYPQKFSFYLRRVGVKYLDNPIIIGEGRDFKELLEYISPQY
jgi:hypothetical protein